MNRDSAVYSEPDKFIPERFLDSEKGPFTSVNNIYACGFGRRLVKHSEIDFSFRKLTIAVEYVPGVTWLTTPFGSLSHPYWLLSI
jgi:hypothetical protein